MINTGIFFLFIFLSGFWLSRSGKPYNGIIFNIHKLIGLATGIFLIATVYRTHQATPLSVDQITAIVVNTLLFFLTIVAGGLLSVAAEGELKNVNQTVRTAISVVHKISPYLVVLSTAVTLYLLIFRNL